MSNGRRDSDAPDERDLEAAPDVEISASMRADELRANVPSKVKVTFEGEGKTTTRRRGVPPTGAVPGVTHRDVEISTKIEARARPRKEPDREARAKKRPPARR